MILQGRLQRTILKFHWLSIHDDFDCNSFHTVLASGYATISALFKKLTKVCLWFCGTKLVWITTILSLYQIICSNMIIIRDDFYHIKAVLHLPHCCTSCTGCFALHRPCVHKLKPNMLIAEYKKPTHNVYCVINFPICISNHLVPPQPSSPK